MKKIIACGLVLAMWGAVSTVCLASYYREPYEVLYDGYQKTKSNYNGFVTLSCDIVEKVKSGGISEMEIANFISNDIRSAEINIDAMGHYCNQLYPHDNMASFCIPLIKQDICDLKERLKNCNQRDVSEEQGCFISECSLDLSLNMIKDNREMINAWL